MATDTDAWLIHADTYELPQEQIPLLKKGEATGETYGWPKGMLGPESTTRLHQKGIHTTSTLIRIAQQLQHEEFRKVFGGKDNVWPNRYEAAHGYLTRVINNAENAAEYRKRCGLDRAAASDIGAGTTQAWAVFADTRQLPQEEIPLLTKTQSGQEFGWPSGLMGPVSTSRLHAKGITRTSQLIQSANRLDHEQFKQEYDEVWPSRFAGAHLYLIRCIYANPANYAEYISRLQAQTPRTPSIQSNAPRQLPTVHQNDSPHHHNSVPKYQQHNQLEPEDGNTRRLLGAWFRQYSIPEDLGVALCIALAALLTSFLAGTYGLIAAILVVWAGLFVLQKQNSLSIFRCFWLALYPFCVQFVASFAVEGAHVPVAAFVVVISLLVVAPDKFPVPV